MTKRVLVILVTVAMLLALLVVMVGAYTRLSDAGLGCPDWPGCYGQLVLPKASQGLDAAQAQYPTNLLEPRKAWTEMIHRYLAGTLATLIFLIGGLVLSMRKKIPTISWHLPVFLMGLVIFQALLGMWTVTLKLLPVVVMGHLLGGMLIFASLARYRLQLSRVKTENLPIWHRLLLLGLLLLFLQIALGGWVSANYAGLACVGFPRCNGLWWPQWHLSEGFHLFAPVGANYQGGVLDSEVRMTIQMIHRLGALIVGLYLLTVGLLAVWRAALPSLRLGALLMLVLLIIQISLGIGNVQYLLPMPVAVAHNGVAALLLGTVFSLIYLCKRRDQHGL